MKELALLARALEYPESDTADAALGAAAAFASHAELAAALKALTTWLESAEPGEAEEQYTRLFDLSPVCTLHCGYHLFGEAYQRGSLLAGLAEELRVREIPVGGELPDYLPSLLRLFAALGGEDRQALAETLLLPGLSRMVAALGDNPLPWAQVLRSLPALVEAKLPAPACVSEGLGAPPKDALRAEVVNA